MPMPWVMLVIVIYVLGWSGHKFYRLCKESDRQSNEVVRKWREQQEHERITRSLHVEAAQVLNRNEGKYDV